MRGWPRWSSGSELVAGDATGSPSTAQREGRASTGGLQSATGPAYRAGGRTARATDIPATSPLEALRLGAERKCPPPCGRYSARPSSIPSASAVRTSCPRGSTRLIPCIAAVIGADSIRLPLRHTMCPNFSRGDEIHRLDAEARREDPIEGGRTAAPLQVAEHGDARLEARAEGDVVRDPFPDPAETPGRAVRAGLLLVDLLAAGGEGALRRRRRC